MRNLCVYSVAAEEKCLGSGSIIYVPINIVLNLIIKNFEAKKNQNKIGWHEVSFKRWLSHTL